ncbi:MAG: hypothetical protein LBD75_01905 [Candidatus Peribacteria bacterium]|jgi:hypothetical protein|nr:hypothetical protein [Candidatus Peribacteria bacterium]
MDTIEKQKDLHQTFLECFDYLNRECLERSPELNSPQISDNIFFAQYTKVKFTKEDYKNWDAMLENMNNTYLFKKYHKALAHHKDFFRYKFNTLCLRQGKLTDEVRDCKYLTSQQFHHYEKEIEKVYQDGIALVKSEYPASEIEEKLGMLQRNKDSFLQLCKSKLKK